MTRIDLPILRTSERKDFKRCPQRWWWAWREGLRPKHPKIGALWFGTGIHLAAEHYYIPGKTRGRRMVDTWREFVDTQWVEMQVENPAGADSGVEKIWMDAGDLGESMLLSYENEYGLDEEWEILAVEYPFQVKVARPGTNIPIVLYAGTLDIVARHIPTGKVYLWDHKTAKTIKINHLPLDDQAGSYWALGTHVLRRDGILKPNETIHGIVYNFLMKSPPDERPVNELGQATNKPEKKHYVESLINFYGEDEPAESELLDPKKMAKNTLAQLEEMARVNKVVVLGEVSAQQPSRRFLRHTVHRTAPERRSQIRHIGVEATWMEAIRDGKLDLFKTPTPDCSWDCDFRQLCELDEREGDIEEYISVVYNSEDPYAAHRPLELEEV